jgi:hypothetical protein
MAGDDDSGWSLRCVLSLDGPPPTFYRTFFDLFPQFLKIPQSTAAFIVFATCKIVFNRGVDAALKTGQQ